MYGTDGEWLMLGVALLLVLIVHFKKTENT